MSTEPGRDAGAEPPIERQRYRLLRAQALVLAAMALAASAFIAGQLAHASMRSPGVLLALLATIGAFIAVLAFGTCRHRPSG